MAIKLIALVITLCVASWDTGEGRSLRFSTTPLNRYSFPPHFDFGVASSAYQYEGAVEEGGRSLSIWDNFTHAFPGGKLSDGVNKEGVQFYKNLIDELIENGIKPFVTIYHWDIPQALDDEYGSFLSPRIIDDFRNYARFCFQEFGDKVSMWTTFNEPYVYSVSGYDAGNKAMGRCSKWVNSLCIAGDSGTEPYLVSHHLLLAHAAAVEEFRKCDKISQDAKIGIVLSPYWFEPYDIASNADKEAVERALTFNIGWHLSPLVFGDYPETIKTSAGNRLPSFTKEQSMMVKNSFDFIGVNYYTARFVAHDLHVDISRPRFTTDQHLQYKCFDDYEDGTVTREEIIEDTKRIEYHQKHLQQLHKAIIEDGCNVKGYFTWSLLDNFEWEHGYAVRFGLYYVDYKNGLKRHAKNSAIWFKHFLQRSGKPMPMELFKSVKRWWYGLQMI
ncbi:unnamed protein product [Arabidopsis arenosa]|uniref:Thioglucosidase n=1 Tax=Arabidopsis arenosa TaxID=38785 RepID=A0A8S2AMS6_ARAAE|nr:unnamed protein product [Arabidopsis arenosa]